LSKHKYDELVKSNNLLTFVIPAKAGIHPTIRSRTSFYSNTCNVLQWRQSSLTSWK